MKNLVIFTAILSLGLGTVQVFFPEIIKKAEEFTDQLFSFNEYSPIDYRRICGLILISIGIALLWLAIKNEF